MAELGYSCAYRVLDAQYFGVPQRRKRVFIVGHLGDWRNPAKVLFESESLSRNTKKSRQARQEVTGYVESSFGQYREDSIAGTTKASGGVLGGGSETFLTVYENHASDSRVEEVNVSPTVRARWGTGGGNVPYVQAIPIHDQATRLNKGNGLGVGNEGDPCPTLTRGDMHMVAHAFKVRGGSGQGGKGYLGSDETAFTLATMQDQYLGIGSMSVRKLTPMECERLQGFPDNYTNIKENCPDGPRYKAMGNSMAVPVMQWIGKRIQMVEDGLL
jgi:DNA (cytosine-5)-methyltransferase 1